ncbi:formyl transferase, partial [Podospora conica]
HHLTPALHTRTRPVRYGDEIVKLLAGNANLVLLARYIQIISPVFLDQLWVPVINNHHSFSTFIDAEPYKKAKGRGVKLIGATSHHVTSDLDKGPIIKQTR